MKKLSILFIVVMTILFTSCEKDLYENNIKTKSKIKSSIISYKNLKINPKVLSKLQQIKDKIQLSKTSKMVNLAKYNFTIDVGRILYVETNDKKTFTFPIYRDLQPDKTENLILELKDDQIKEFLAKYNLSSLDKSKLKNNENIDINNKLEIEKLTEKEPCNTKIDHCVRILTESGEVVFEVTYADPCSGSDDGGVSDGGGGDTGSSDGSSDGFDIGTIIIFLPSNPTIPNPGSGVNPSSNGGGNEGSSGTEVSNNDNNPDIFSAPLLNDYDSYKAYKIANQIKSLISLSEIQFSYLTTHLASGEYILQYLKLDLSQSIIDLMYSIIDASIQLNIDALSVWNDYDHFRAEMSDSERNIFDNLLPNRKLWYMCSAKKAFDTAAEFFPVNSLHNGKGDAFRHALWKGLCYLTLAGNLGEQLTTAHETKPNEIPGYNYNYKEVQMDLYNNSIGRQIGSVSNLTNVTQNVLDNLNYGFLRYLNNLQDFTSSSDIIYHNLATNLSILIPTDQ